jgi:hypothetical protein
MKISDKKVHCNLATVDFMFQINLKDVSLFVNPLRSDGQVILAAVPTFLGWYRIVDSIQ